MDGVAVHQVPQPLGGDRVRADEQPAKRLDREGDLGADGAAQAGDALVGLNLNEDLLQSVAAAVRGHGRQRLRQWPPVFGVDVNRPAQPLLPELTLDGQRAREQA